MGGSSSCSTNEWSAGAPREILEEVFVAAVKNQKDFNKGIFEKTKKYFQRPILARNRKWTR
jgi:hypothetical protein